MNGETRQPPLGCEQACGLLEAGVRPGQAHCDADRLSHHLSSCLPCYGFMSDLRDVSKISRILRAQATLDNDAAWSAVAQADSIAGNVMRAWDAAHPPRAIGRSWGRRLVEIWRARPVFSFAAGVAAGLLIFALARTETPVAVLRGEAAAPFDQAPSRAPVTPTVSVAPIDLLDDELLSDLDGEPTRSIFDDLTIVSGALPVFDSSTPLLGLDDTERDDLMEDLEALDLGALDAVSRALGRLR